MKEVIHIQKSEVKKPRRHWVRKPQTQVLPRKKKSSRKEEKQRLRKEWTREISDELNK